MKSTRWNSKWMRAWLLALVIPCCSTLATKSSTSASASSSALYAPPTITLLPRVPYQCLEGILTLPSAQRFHSDFAYRLAAITGREDALPCHPVSPAK